MIPEPEIPDDDEMLEPDCCGPAAHPVHRVSRRLKYKEKGYRIERTRDGRRWTLVSYYRSPADMRKAYAATGQKEFWDGSHYRMVFPDGAILPKRYDNGPGGYDYWFHTR